jgi:hypothetical protein
MTFPRGSLAAAVVLTLGATGPLALAQDPPAQAAHETYSSKRFVEVVIDRARAENKKSLELWVTTDAGQTWVNHGDVDATKPAAPFQAPRDGRYGFLLVPVAADGRRETTPKAGDAAEKTIVVDTVPPVVEVLSPNGGEIFGAGRSTVIQWAAADANLDPTKGITIEASTGKDTWIAVAQNVPNSGKYHWDIPPALSTMTCRIKVSARDLAGNVSSDASDNDFTIDGLAPELRISGPTTANEVPVKIEWTGGDLGGSGLKRVALWVTRDGGQTWKLHGDDAGLKSPFLFTELDGIYGLKLVGEDKMGNANPSPVPGMPPLFTLTLDRTKPEVKLSSPTAGGYPGGVPVDVQWMAKDNVDMPANGIALAWSDDGGRTWKDIAKGLKNDGLYKWTPPRTTLADCRLKITAADFAGNVSEVVSERFGIDGSVPEARATGPDRSGTSTVQIAYEIKNRGSSPLKSVELWFRPENVKEWSKYGEDPDREPPFTFTRPDGKYGIYLRCATEIGLKSGFVQKGPDNDTEAQLTLVIDSQAPVLELTSFHNGGVVIAGAAADITWKMTEPNPDPRGLSIYHSPDGGKAWNLVAANVDALKGSYRWGVPNVTGTRHKLRLVAVDRFGNRGQTESEKLFTIDNDLPSVAVLERPPQVTRSARIAAKYKASDPTSGVDKVVLYGRKLSEKGPYKVLTETKNAEGTIETELPGEGVWALLLVAMDGAGHASADPDRVPKPDMVVTLDITKPEIALRSFTLPAGGKTWLNGAWEVEWTATDSLTPYDKIVLRIESSSDGGRTWFVIVPRHNNAGRADLRAHLLQGKKYSLRLVAIDEAGNEAEATTGEFDPGEVPPPGLVLRGIEDGRQLVVGATAALSWSSPDKLIREATLEFSKDGGRTWAFFSALNGPSVKVILPDLEGRYQFRATAKDAANRPTSSNVITFDMISGVEQVRIIANASAEPGGFVAAVIEPKSIVKTAKELRLELSENAQDWTALSEIKGTSFTFKAPLKPGEFLVRAVVKAADGKEYDSNHFRFTVRDRISGIHLRNFRGGQRFSGGASLPILIQTESDLSQVKVEFSDNGGKEGSWKKLSDLKVIATGFHWTLPKITSAACRLRVSAIDEKGREQVDGSDKDFAIETGDKPAPVVVTPPEVKPTVDDQGEPLRLKTVLPDKVKGGTKLRIDWVAKDLTAKVVVRLVIDGNPGVIFEDQSAVGGMDLFMPKVDKLTAHIVLSSSGKSWTSRALEIVSHAPAIDGVDIEIPKK